jgi:vitamin B12 transporter
MDVLTREDIARVQAPDLAALLQETLNLGVTRYGAYGNRTDISIRGFDAERIAFLLNGIPVNSANSGGFEMSQVDLNAIERIEVIYGGSDSKYNVTGALGGVVNIITIKEGPAGLRVSGSAANTSFLPGVYYKPNNEEAGPNFEDLADTQKLAFAAGYTGADYSVSGNIFGNRAGNHYLYRDMYFDKTRRKTNNEVWDAGGSGFYIRNLAGLTRLIVSADVYYADKNIPTSGYAEIAGVQTDFSTRQNIMLDMPRFMRDSVSMEASASHNWQILGYRPPVLAASEHDEHALTAIARLSWRLAPALTLKSGGDYRYTLLNSSELSRKDQTDGGVYLTAEYRPAERLLVSPSVKAVFNSNGSAAVPVPKLGLAWFASDALTLKNNYFRSFRHPDFQDLYWPALGDAAGNPDLKPEDGWGGDLIAAWRRGALTLDAAFFAQYVADTIYWTPTGRVWRPLNVGEGFFFGADGKASAAVPLRGRPPLTLTVSYQYLRSYVSRTGFDLSGDMRMPYSPEHRAGVSADIPWRTGSLLVSARFEGRRYTERTNTIVLDPHFTVDVNVNKRLSDNWTLFGEVRNLLNASYESHINYPMPGASLTLGARYQLAISSEQ